MIRAGRYLVFGALFLSMTFEGCSSKSTKPIADHPNLLQNGSFEVNGIPSLASWRYFDSGAVSLDSVSPVGGAYCLSLATSWLPPTGFVWTSVPGAKKGDILTLTATVRAPKDRGMLSPLVALTVGPSPSFLNLGHAQIGFTNSSWSTVSLVDTVSPGPTDSVWVVLRGAGCELCQAGVAQFDSVSVYRQ